MSVQHISSRPVTEEDWAAIRTRPHFVITLTDEELTKLVEFTQDGSDESDLELELDLKILISGFNLSPEAMGALRDIINELGF